MERLFKRTLKWVIASLLLALGVSAGTLAAQTELVCPEPVIDDATPMYYVGLGQVYFGQEQFTDAVQVYTCAIDAQPAYAPAYAHRGYAYAALGDVEHAFADYNQAVELDEALTLAYTNRGVLYTTLGNFGLAINDFTLAIALNPNDAAAYNNRGVVHAAEGNFDLAIADFEQAIEIDPDFTMPYASLGAVYSALASQNYQRYVEIEGENARLPAGTPGGVLAAVDDSLRTGNFSVWLALLAPAQ